MPKYRVAYLREIGPYGAQNVKVMERLKSWAESHRLLNENAVILGIAHDDPNRVDIAECRYDTCIVIPTDFKIPIGDTAEGILSGGKYVIFEIEHTAAAVQKAWMNIFKELSSRGYRQDQTRPIIERYASQMIGNHLCEICVPILE